MKFYFCIYLLLYAISYECFLSHVIIKFARIYLHGFWNNVRGFSAPLHKDRAILSFLSICKDYLAYLWG